MWGSRSHNGPKWHPRVRAEWVCPRAGWMDGLAQGVRSIHAKEKVGQPTMEVTAKEGEGMYVGGSSSVGVKI